MNQDTEQHWRRLCEKLASAGYESLSESERLWVNIRSLIDAVQGGGLISYFYNSGADTLPDCLMALDTLDAPAVRALVQQVSALFGASVPSSLEERNEIIDGWPDENEELDELLEDVDAQLMPLMEDLETKLVAYLGDHAIAT